MAFYLPKSSTQLDLQSLEASTLSDLVISSTALVNQRRNSKDDKNKRVVGVSPRRDDSNRNKNWSGRSDSNKTSPGRRDGRTYRKSQSPNKGTYRGSQSPNGDKKNQNRGRESRQDGNRGQNRGFQGQRYSRTPSADKRQERSTSRAQGSPIRLQGCIRCSSTNHKAEFCTRFDFWEGSKCRHCNYLHDYRLCPFFTKDNRDKKNRSEKKYIPPKDNDNSYRNAYQVELVQQPSENRLRDNRQSASGDYIPKLPQPGTKVQDNIFDAKN